MTSKHELDRMAAEVTKALLFPMRCKDTSENEWNMSKTALKSVVCYVGEDSAKEIMLTSTLDENAEFDLYTAAVCISLADAFDNPLVLASAVEDEILPVVRQVLEMEDQLLDSK